MIFLEMNPSDLTVFHRLKVRIRIWEEKILDCHWQQVICQFQMVQIEKTEPGRQVRRIYSVHSDLNNQGLSDGKNLLAEDGFLMR